MKAQPFGTGIADTAKIDLIYRIRTSIHSYTRAEPNTSLRGGKGGYWRGYEGLHGEVWCLEMKIEERKFRHVTGVKVGCT
jgi:hypothetical protein